MSTSPRVTLDALLGHDDFVRGLSRSLLGRDDRAGDVAQDAWLAAAQGGPRSEASARAWFAQVVRNRVASLRRKDRSAERWERRQPRARAVPDSAEILGREDMRRRVVAALLALDPIYRECLILKFYEGLKPREIAERIGVPVETVRTRTRRGLEKMREALDAAVGDRRRWMAALAPLVGGPPARVGSAPWLLACLGVLAVAALIFWSWDSDGGEVALEEATAAVHEAPQLRGRGAVAPTEDAPPADASPESKPARWRITGTMRWKTGGGPAARIKMEGRLMSGRKTMAVLGETWSEQDGTYRLPLDALTELSPATLAASTLFLTTPGVTHDAWPPGHEVPLRILNARKHEQVIELDWTVYGPEDGQGHVGGRLVDGDGNPVVDGDVDLYRGTPGNYTLVKGGNVNRVGDFDVPAGSSTYYSGGSGIQEPETLTLIATSRGSGRLVMPGVRVHPKQDLWLGTLTLEPSEHIVRARILLENGQPAAGVVVMIMRGTWHALSQREDHRLTYHDPRLVVRTLGSDGRLEAHVEGAGPYCLWVDPRGSRRHGETMRALPPNAELMADGTETVVTVPGSVLRVRFTDEAGRPAAGAQWNAVGWLEGRKTSADMMWKNIERVVLWRSFSFIERGHEPDWSMDDNARMKAGRAHALLDEVAILAPEGSHWIVHAWTTGLYGGQARFEVPPLGRGRIETLPLRPIEPASFSIEPVHEGQPVAARFGYFYYLDGADDVRGRGTLRSGEKLKGLLPGRYTFQLRCQTHRLAKHNHFVSLRPGEDHVLKPPVQPGGFLHIDVEAPRRPFSPHPLRAQLHIKAVASERAMRPHRFSVTPTDDGGVYARLGRPAHPTRVPFLLKPGRYLVHITAKGYDTEPVEVDIRVDEVSTAHLSLRAK